MTITPSSYPGGLPTMKAGRWSDVVRAIEDDGGPITIHPDTETLRRRTERLPNLPPAPAPIGPILGNREAPMDLDEDPPAPIPARPYPPTQVTLDDVVDMTHRLHTASRRGWLSRAIHRRFG